MLDLNVEIVLSNFIFLRENKVSFLVESLGGLGIKVKRVTFLNEAIQEEFLECVKRADVIFCLGDFSPVELRLYGAQKAKIFTLPDSFEEIKAKIDLEIAPYFRFPQEKASYGAQKKSLTLALQEWMIQHQKTFACAESCTGGFISHLITLNPGASHYFLGAFVTYTNELKESLLSLKKEDLMQNGSVSKETVLSMLKGVFEKTQADFALAVSGIAGPKGGSLEKPVGTVWFAIGKRGEIPLLDFFQLKGSRRDIIEQASFQLLELLLQKVKSECK